MSGWFRKRMAELIDFCNVSESAYDTGGPDTLPSGRGCATPLRHREDGEPCTCSRGVR